MTPSNFFSDCPACFLQSTALRLDPAKPLYVILHFEKGCKFSLHHLAQFPLLFYGRNLQTTVSPVPALVSLAHLGTGILTCRIDELKGAVFAVLPTCGCCFEVCVSRQCPSFSRRLSCFLPFFFFYLQSKGAKELQSYDIFR